MAKKGKSSVKKPRRTAAKRSTKKKARTAAPRAAETRADAVLVERTLELLHAQDRVVAGARRAVGAHILDAYFGGDDDLARSNAPNKPKSFALLAERAEAETAWDARDLSEAVRMEVCARSLPVAVAEALGPSHLLRLAAVDDASERARLAARIARGELGGLAAKNAIAEAAAGGAGGGRKRQPDAVRFASALQRALARADEDNAFDPTELNEVDDREGLARRLQVMADRIAHFAKRAAG
jgi:hypothetical protein